jgi:transposase
MAGKSKLPPLVLSAEEEQRLATLGASRAAPLREVERARILLQYQRGNNPSAIQRALNISRVTIYHCLHKALEMGVEAGLKDAFHRPKEPVITTADKAWVVHLACTKPKDLGYAAELWTRQALAAHVRQHAAIWPAGPTASTMFTHPSTAPGLIWLKRSLAKWRTPS